MNIEGLYDTNGKIRTYSGKYIDPFNPNPDDICIEDIAHALSNQCRFAGHTQRFYSVAQHSLFVMNVVHTKYKLQALMHDASEAYLLDIPTPIKMKLPAYKAAEDGLMIAIAAKFGFDWPMSEYVKNADRYALEAEWSNAVCNDIYFATRPMNTEHEFLTEFKRLTTNRR